MKTANVLETYDEIKNAMMSGKDVSFEICTEAVSEQVSDKASDRASDRASEQASYNKLSQYRIGAPYSVNGTIIGVISAITVDNGIARVLVTALEDLCDNINWYDACEKCENLPHGFRLPTKLDICLWAANLDKINASLEKHGKPFKDDAYYWSSSEYDGYSAWGFCTDTGASQGGVNLGIKYYYNSNLVVRPVLTFTLSL